MRSRSDRRPASGHPITLPGSEEAQPTRLRVLAVTNMWPSEASPIKGVYCQRQMISLNKVNIAVDVVAIDGNENALTSIGPYLRAAVEMAKLNLGPRRYDVIHAHTGHC